jgi:hypothetical protein
MHKIDRFHTSIQSQYDSLPSSSLTKIGQDEQTCRVGVRAFILFNQFIQFTQRMNWMN